MNGGNRGIWRMRREARSGAANLRGVGTGFAVAVFALVVLLTPSAATAAAQCGRVSATNSPGGNAILNVAAKHLGCTKARSLIRRAWRSDIYEPGDSRQIGVYRCVSVHTYDPGETAIRCRHGSRVAKGSWTDAYDRREKPPIVKACGGIHVAGKHMRVDIPEAMNMRPDCSTARTVMRRFVRRSPPPMGDGSVRYGGRRYSCYRSRPDGEGWDYHCSWSNGSASRYIDFGAGRRFGGR
jgi:hypothetical protein